MSTTEQYYKAIADYGGVEEDANYIAVKKGDKVRLIKKDKEWFTVEKDGRIGKVPKGILIQKGIKITQNQMNLPIQTVQPSPQIMNSIKSQNDQEPIKSMIPIDKQKSQIIPPGQKEQIEQQSDSLLQSITNPKSHSGSGSSKSKKKQKVIEEKDPNSEWKTRIPDQIIKIVKERICPLIHLNCPPEINCQQCVNVPQSPALIELKSDVFQTLDKVSNVNFEFKDMLKNYHNIILHLTHPLIQFASESQFKKKTNSQEQHDQQQTESSSSHSLITYSLNLLDSLIMDNNKCKQVINTPKALHSLIPLSGYKLNIHFNQENDQQTFAVRHSSRECLWHIQYYGGASAQSELVNARYARVLVIAISTASGAGEEQDEEICNGLYRISKFLRDIHQGNYSSFPPQPLLVRRSVEQIEEEGGNEEIDVQMNNKGCYGNIKYHANRAKGRILNYFIELGNPKPNWYYW
ncbi:MAG: hypothetical protein EZS28_024829 [Streblomastix strix]|uniref:SH3 domain-containing protein n=1 Tax=Streblomastix strix TaxID=222440 RepID=A0A5J4VB86_9EUKA|nr:MAG: hypothetical protein EZS28_024829 [Streblomastix strix]